VLKGSLEVTMIVRYFPYGEPFNSYFYGVYIYNTYSYCIVLFLLLRAPNVVIGLQSRQFWATSMLHCRERLLDFRSCWRIVFIHVVLWCSGGLIQFSKGGSCIRSWHLFGLAFVQCGWTGWNAVLGQ